MSLPADVIDERERSLAALARREARAIARIKRALRTLADVRRKQARDRAELVRAVERAAELDATRKGAK